MNKALLIKENVRKYIDLPDGDKIEIYNYTDKDVKKIFDMCQKCIDNGKELEFSTPSQINNLLKMFTNLKLTVKEVGDMIKSPSFYFEQVLAEIRLVLSEITVLFYNKKREEIADVRIELAKTDMMSEMENTYKLLNDFQSKLTKEDKLGLIVKE